MKEKTSIRSMIRRDLPEVVRIENHCFHNPWDEADFRKVMMLHGNMGIVLTKDSVIVGFCIYNIQEQGQAIALVDLAVHPEHRRCGYGSQLVKWVQNKAKRMGRLGIADTISERNLRAQLFFKANGFLAKKVLRNEFCSGHDGYLMVWEAKTTDRCLV